MKGTLQLGWKKFLEILDKLPVQRGTHEITGVYSGQKKKK